MGHHLGSRCDRSSYETNEGFIDDNDKIVIDGDTIGIADVTGSVTDGGRFPEKSENVTVLSSFMMRSFPKNIVSFDGGGYSKC